MEGILEQRLWHAHLCSLASLGLEGALARRAIFWAISDPYPYGIPKKAAVRGSVSAPGAGRASSLTHALPVTF